MALRRNTRKTVEDFLAWAFDPDFRFLGKEWADDDSGDLAVEEPPPNSPSPLDFTMVEGPYVRLRCVNCGQTCDAWLDERGDLEDWRDAFHWHQDEGPRGEVVRHNREIVGDDTS